MRIVDLDGLNELRCASQQKLLPGRPRIGVGLGTCGIGNGARAVFDALAREIAGRASTRCWCRSAASAGAPPSRWSMSICPGGRSSCSAA